MRQNKVESRRVHVPAPLRPHPEERGRRPRVSKDGPRVQAGPPACVAHGSRRVAARRSSPCGSPCGPRAKAEGRGRL